MTIAAGANRKRPPERALGRHQGSRAGRRRRSFGIETLCILPTLVVALAAVLTGCAVLGDSETHLPAIALEPVEYYPGEVKGYQGTLPERRVLVLLPTDQRLASRLSGAVEARAEYPLGGVEVGVIDDRSGSAVQRIYAPRLQQTVQQALIESAQEAGLTAAPSSETLESALRRTGDDYVMASNVTFCWVAKDYVSDRVWGGIWVTDARFALRVQIYKPPFRVAFWKGEQAVHFSDPPYGGGLVPLDLTGMFSRPAQVLSVSLTRAVAGIMASQDLEELITQDSGRKQQSL